MLERLLLKGGGEGMGGVGRGDSIGGTKVRNIKRNMGVRDFPFTFFF